MEARVKRIWFSYQHNRSLCRCTLYKMIKLSHFEVVLCATTLTGPSPTQDSCCILLVRKVKSLPPKLCSTKSNIIQFVIIHAFELCMNLPLLFAGIIETLYENKWLLASPRTKKSSFLLPIFFPLAIKMQIWVDKLRIVLSITYTFNLTADLVIIKGLLKWKI